MGNPFLPQMSGEKNCLLEFIMNEVRDDGNGGAWYGNRHYLNKSDAEYEQRQDMYREWEEDDRRYEESKKKSSGGCLSTIFGALIIAGAVWVGKNFGLKGIIIAVVFCFFVIPGLIAFIIGMKKK